MIAAVVILTLGGGALVAWEMFLRARRDESAAQRVHELAVHAARVVVDQAALDTALASVKRLEERVKTLEYRPR